MQYIQINKDIIPFKFDIQLDGTTFTLALDYNAEGDFFTTDLLRDKTLLKAGEKLVYGKPLFLDIQYRGLPSTAIIPYDPSGRSSRITYDNLSVEVLLFLIGGEDDGDAVD